MTPRDVVARGGRPVAALPPDGNAHAGRPWSADDHAAQLRDLAAWRRAFAPAPACPACSWPFVVACPCRGDRP